MGGFAELHEFASNTRAFALSKYLNGIINLLLALTDTALRLKIDQHTETVTEYYLLLTQGTLHLSKCSLAFINFLSQCLMLFLNLLKLLLCLNIIRTCNISMREPCSPSRFASAPSPRL